MNGRIAVGRTYSVFARFAPVAVIAALFAGCSGHDGNRTASAASYRRIISFAPSITETLFALGLGDRVVGVTRFCAYPPQAKKLPAIGGYLDPNYEMILSLKPDLVLLLREHGPVVAFLDKNKIAHAGIDNETVDGILASFETIGGLCGAGARADSLVNSIRAEIARQPVSGKRPRVLFCIGRDNPGGGSVAKIYIAGRKTFYSECIGLAGGVNAYQDSSVAYPSLSGEGIAQLAPDIIVDAMASVTDVPAEKIKEDWNCLSMVPAVKNHMVFCLTGDYVTIPGPRIGLVLRDLAGIIDRYRSPAGSKAGG